MPLAKLEPPYRLTRMPDPPPPRIGALIVFSVTVAFVLLAILHGVYVR